MNKERLAAMPYNALAYDTETWPIVPGLVSPKRVLGSAAEPNFDGGKLNLHGKLLDKNQCRGLFRAMLADSKYTVVVANGPFDFLVEAVDAAQFGEDLMPAIFNMYDPEGTIVRGHCNGRVFDVQRAEELHAIAQGLLNKHPYTGMPLMHPVTGKHCGYSLEVVTWMVQGRLDAKTNDKFRLTYYLFDDMPIDQLPFEAAQYPVDDGINTLGDGLAQAGHSPGAFVHEWASSDTQPGVMQCNHCGLWLDSNPPDACMRLQSRENLHDLARQTYAAWALHLSDSWGFNVDQKMVDDLEKKYADRRESLVEPFLKLGILRENGTENQSVLKQIIARAYGARSFCQTCDGTGKVPSPKTNGKTKINCDDCKGTTLQLPAEVPRTETGGVGTSADVLAESGDEDLMGYADLGKFDKIESTYIPLMRRARMCSYCNQQVGARIDKKPVTHTIECAVHDGSPPKWYDVTLNARSRPLVETGRCAVPDGLHGLPRSGGVRDCFRSRPGWVFSSTDYAAGELVTHSQNCINVVGYSKMAEALNAGLDAHLALAGTVLGKDYETMLALKKAKDKLADYTRQGSKAGNFGFLGGMAELTFTLRKRADPDLFTPCENGPNVNAKGVRGFKGLRPCILMDGYDRCGIKEFMITEYKGKACAPVCSRCVAASKRLRDAFFRQWPENNNKDGYQYYIGKWAEEGQPLNEIQRRIHGRDYTAPGQMIHHFSHRLRGGVQFTDFANGLFQGFLADAMKNAYCHIQRECYDKSWRVRSSEMMSSAYDGGESPLFGSRSLLLFHDETLAEHPLSVAHDAATRIGEIQVEALRFACPDMYKAVKAEPALTFFLAKGAETVRDANDRLIPWEP